MALPVVKTLADSADYYKTVAPYISQLYDLPYQIFEAIKTNPSSLSQIYLDTNPLVFAFAFALFLVPLFLLLSEINRNYSQVDRVWSILPTVFNIHYVAWAHLHNLDTKRLDALLAASVIWSFRLTYNYWRKGGYSVGSEDYRWEILRKHIPAPLFFAFNVLFISLAQSVLLWSITTPTYILLLRSRLAQSGKNTPADYDGLDMLFSRFLVALVLLTYIADNQQWHYQTIKQNYKSSAKLPSDSKFSQIDLERGFLTKGLFGWSRHPNFAAEQSFWVTLYIWAAVKSETPFNWTAIGAVSYLILFQASTWFTESVSAKKYPDYKVYQKKVGMFLPTRLRPVKETDFEIASK
ncbi:hypothetical protein UCRPC4_g04294 [Phaeomoniella chlamydospora]|uniref:Duf1295 domain protein n=1 Tax=Phaeomoniella chlamydospora TaxID=158046 RepID=A0A0G2EC11_PHACM|nr:hypothetical protein UCRPC4_g04294 [Phaeomoniella chlamydospora]